MVKKDESVLMLLYFRANLCQAGSVITLDRSASATAAAAESADPANIIINVIQPALDCEGGGDGSRSGEEDPTTASTTAGQPTGAKLIMGRKKIQITQIADERNRQVIMLSS